MKGTIRIPLVVALIFTGISVAVWQVTGGDYYTKYEVVEKVKTDVDQNDPLAAAGFYDEDTKAETVVRKAFRLGLLPTPNGLLDKHAVSVASVVAPVWAVSVIAYLVQRRRRGNVAAESA